MSLETVSRPRHTSTEQTTGKIDVTDTEDSKGSDYNSNSTVDWAAHMSDLDSEIMSAASEEVKTHSGYGEEVSDDSSEGSPNAGIGLLTLKFIFFSIFAAVGILATFLPLYLKEVGLSAGQIGTVLFFRPIGGFFAGIISPVLVTKFPSQERAMLFFSGLFVANALCIGLLPLMSLEDRCPSSLIWYSHYRNLTSEISNVTSQISNVRSGTTDERQAADKSWMYHTDNLALVISTFSFLVFSGEFFLVSVDTFLHGITMTRLGNGNSQSYGLIRSWGAVGHGIGATVTGAIISITVEYKKTCGQLYMSADYHCTFYVLSCFALFTSLNIGNMLDTSTKEQTTTIMSRDLCLTTLSKLNNMAWLFIVLCRSMFYAVTQGFLYWHMENIGASPALIGTANLITTATEFMMFFATPKLIKIFGHARLVTVGIISYICRFTLFSCISNPIYILPVEVIEGAMFACVWSAIVSYLSNQVKDEGQTQIQGVVQSVFMMGTSVGFLLSGALTELMGVAAMFLSFAALATVALVVFVIALVVHERRGAST